VIVDCKGLHLRRGEKFMTFFITGATGHLGYHLTRDLLNHGHQVYALVLLRDPLLHTLPQGVQIVTGNILDEEALASFFAHPSDGYKVLIHAASRVTTQSKADSLTYQVNVVGTQNIIRQAKLAKIDHLIYISSVHALKELPMGQVMNENQLAFPHEVKGFYAKTKAEATQMVWQAHLRDSLPVSIVYPSGFIGPNDEGNGYTTLMIKEAMHGRMNVWFKGGYDFVDVRDIGRAVMTIAEKKLVGKTYVLNHAYLPFNHMMRLIDKAMKHRPIRLFIPRFLIYFGIPFLKIYYILTKKKPLLTYYAFSTMQTNAAFDHSKATEDFGFMPRPFSETVIDTVNVINTTKKNFTKSLPK
jgi:dihydroflavonol-4-reductase